MLKLRSQVKEFFCAALLVFLGVFLSACVMFRQPTVYANDEVVKPADQGEYFVTIYDNGTSLTVKTSSTTVAEVLEKSDVEIAETDIVEPSLDAVIDGDYNINIYRARPALVIDGVNRRYIMTASYDPKQVAIESGLTVYDGDEVQQEFNHNFLEAGALSTYRITRNGGRRLSLEETIPYQVETRYDFNLPKGERILEQPGEEGRKVSIYEVEFQDNVEVSRTLIEEKVIAEAVPEVVVEGAKVSIPPEREQCAAWAREAGVSELDLEAALDLIYRESGCRVDARNASSGAYGIPQSLPGNKMLEMGEDWETNPVTQIRWMIKYVNNRYGGWQQALDYWWCTGVCSTRYGTVNKNGYWY